VQGVWRAGLDCLAGRSLATPTAEYYIGARLLLWISPELKAVLKFKLNFVPYFKSHGGFWKIPLSPKIKTGLNTALGFNFKECSKTQYFSKS